MDAPPAAARRFVRNRAALLSHGAVALRRVALDIVEQALAASDPYPAALAALTPPGLLDGAVALRGGERILFVGAGKASYPIAKAAEEALGERLADGLVICKHGDGADLKRIKVRHAAHPVPDQAGAAAAAELRALAATARAGDIVIAGITGGSSALFIAPAAGLTLADLQATTSLLLGCGADIVEINAVRKHLSAVGGGKFAAGLATGVRLINLTVSDVIGDGLDVITDPTVPDSSTLDDARRTLDHYRLWRRVPQAVAAFLRPGGGAVETPKALPDIERHDRILVPFAAPCEAALACAGRRGFAGLLLTTSLAGESREAGRLLAGIAREIVERGRPVPPPAAIVLGGETVVTLDEDAESMGAELGGPNQEIALAAAIGLAGLPNCVVAALGTDGTDGPTDYAGGLVDGASAGRAAELGLDLRAALRRHDSTAGLSRLGDIVETGATGTNVSDLLILLVGSRAENSTER